MGQECGTSVHYANGMLTFSVLFYPINLPKKSMFYKIG